MELSCEICERKCATKYSLFRHRKNVHNIEFPQKLYTSKCNSCPDLSFSKKTLLIDHLNASHSMAINKEIIQFSNISEFLNWKVTFELEEKSMYILNTGKKNGKHGSTSYYECCRSGEYKEKAIKNRSTKSQGTKKINFNCTSHIVLFEPFETEECFATVYKEHYGHKTDELQHLSISMPKKYEIASKISQGVTFEKILDNYRNRIDTDLKREHLITRKDLHNIKQKFEGQLHKNDVTSVDIRVEQKKRKNNPVICNKKQAYINVTDCNQVIELEKCESIVTTNYSNIESTVLESKTQNTRVTSSVEKEMEIHIKSTQSLKDTSKVYDIFKDKAVSIGDQIKDVKNPEHLKVAMKNLDALATFISVVSNENQIIPFKADNKTVTVNKKNIKRNSFFLTKNKRFERTDSNLTRPTSDEEMDLNNIFLNNTFEVLKRHDFEHSYSKIMRHFF